MAHEHEIAKAAHEHALDVRLVRAVVLVESGENEWAWNPEPRFRYLWDVRRNAPFRHLTAAEIASEVPPPDFPTLAGDRDQEWWCQTASWGLMQVMGGVARELGCRAPYLTSLCSPAVGLHWGCLKLRQNIDHAAAKFGVAPDMTLRAALAAYNGGWVGNDPRHAPLRNDAYAAKVLARV
jgi:hypothetical protein